MLGAFVALADGAVVRALQQRAGKSPVAAAALPLLLLAPYLLYAAGTRSFSWSALLKLTAYLLAPAILLLPDYRRHRATANARDIRGHGGHRNTDTGWMAARHLDVAGEPVLPAALLPLSVPAYTPSWWSGAWTA